MRNWLSAFRVSAPPPTFEPIKIGWKGREYQIAPDQVLPAICKVEDIITLGELTLYLESQHLPLGKLASAWGAALRHAGAHVPDDDIYRAMFEGEAAEVQDNAVATALALQALMVPPAHLRREPKKATATGPASASSPKFSS